jgi:hypothetical protein
LLRALSGGLMTIRSKFCDGLMKPDNFGEKRISYAIGGGFFSVIFQGKLGGLW